MQIKYNGINEEIEVIDDNGNIVLRMKPENLIDALNESLVMQIHKIRQNKITHLEYYIKQHEIWTTKLEDATDRFTLQKYATLKNVLKEVRHAVNLLEREEAKLRSEILMRKAGK